MTSNQYSATALCEVTCKIISSFISRCLTFLLIYRECNQLSDYEITVAHCTSRQQGSSAVEFVRVTISHTL